MDRALYSFCATVDTKSPHRSNRDGEESDERH